MVAIEDWPTADTIAGDRLLLEPLRVADADELAPLLSDPRLHTFIGGRPATLAELRSRFARQVVGRPEDGSERWLNWVLRLRRGGAAVGTVQATVATRGGHTLATLAWVVVPRFQSRGYATEAARAMAAWLREHGVEVLMARVHPRHEASNAVARGVGLAPTEEVVDGEVTWIG